MILVLTIEVPSSVDRSQVLKELENNVDTGEGITINVPAGDLEAGFMFDVSLENLVNLGPSGREDSDETV